jgi:formamidopyrimidine-DNA glycosylase
MKVYKRCRQNAHFRQQTCLIQQHNQSSIKQNVVHKTSKGRCAMARLDSRYQPRGNPCAQCGKPIAKPDWVESSPGRTSFLWFCRACDYRFEAVAIYEEADPDALAA